LTTRTQKFEQPVIVIQFNCTIYKVPLEVSLSLCWNEKWLKKGYKKLNLATSNPSNLAIIPELKILSEVSGILVI